jgi:hypothetical protein
MVDRADVELAIRVRDLASATFGEVEKAVENLTAALGDQIEQARTGKISIGELRESFEKLRQAEQALLSQQGLIDRFNRQTEKLKQATAAIDANAAATAAHAARLKDGETATKAWTRENARLESQSQRGAKAAAELTADLGRTQAALQAAGVDTRDLTAAQTALLNVSRQVGQAKTVTKAAMDGYSRNVRIAREEVRRLAEEERKAAAAATVAEPSAATATGATRRRGRGGETGLFGLRGFELQNLGYQINDVVTQLAGGTGIGQVIGQQGGQILQIFNRNLFDLIALIPRFAPAIAGATAAILALNRAAADRESTRTFRADLMATTSTAAIQAERLTELRRAVQLYGVSWADAGTAMREAIGAGVSQDRLGDMLRTAQAISDRTGGKLPEIMRGLTEGFSGGYEALVKLNEQYQFLDRAAAQRLKAMFDEGKQAEANAEAYTILAQKQQAAAEIVNGPWTRAMREVLALGGALNGWLANTGPIQAYGRYLSWLAGRIGAVAGAMRELITDSPAAMENRLADLDERIAGMSERSTGPVGMSSELARLKEDRAKLAAALERARKEPTSPIVGIRDVDTIRADGTLAALDRQIEAAGGLTEERELALRVEKAINEEMAKGPLSTEAKAALEDRVRALYDAEKAAKAQKEHNERLLKYAREKAEAEDKIKDFLENQERTQVKLVANDKERVRLAGQKAREELRARGGEFVTEDQLNLAQRNAERAMQAEIDKAAATSARQEAAASLSLLKQANALQTQLASLSRAGGNRAFQDLENRLRAIDDQFETLTRNIAAYEQGGGRSVGGQSLAAFRVDAGAAAERAKQYETIKTQEEEVNRIIQERNVLIQTYQALQQTGAITQTEALEKVKQAYETSTPEIILATAKLEELLVKARDTSAISSSQFDVMTAKIRLFRAEAQYVDPLMASLGRNIESAFSGSIVSGMQSVISIMADFASGTASAADVFRSFGRAVLGVLSNVASAIASTIVQFYALRALSSVGGALGFSSFLPMLLGLGASAAGSSFFQGGMSSLNNLGFSGMPSGFQGGFRVMHTGGVVGDGGVRRLLPPGLFLGAPRYHGGGMVGIRPDEQAAVLQKGEEVLTRSDPRHRENGGGGATAIRNVLVMDPAEVAGAMSGTAGERVILTTIKNNAASIRHLVRS